MTDAELSAIEERASAATAGPWRWTCSESRPEDWTCPRTGVLLFPDGCDFGWMISGGIIPEHDEDWGWCVFAGFKEEDTIRPEAADIAFVLAARADVPALVAEVRFLRGLLADLQEDGKDVREVERLRREMAVLGAT